MLNDRAIFEQPHHQALELLSAQALARRDMAAAYRFSDRRCRVPPLPEPYCFILRADALSGLGDRRAALADVARALEIAPDDLAANRRMLAWGRGQNRRDAACVLIAHDRDTTTLRDAIAVLRGGAREAFATVRIQGGIACGWAAWPRHGDIEVVIGGGRGAVKSVLQPQSSHPLAGVLGKAAQFKFPLPASATTWSFTLSYGGETLVALTTDRNVSRIALPATDEAVRSRLRPIPTGNAPTVVVPVYADYEATSACLNSVIKGADGARVLIVNDAEFLTLGSHAI